MEAFPLPLHGFDSEVQLPDTHNQTKPPRRPAPLTQWPLGSCVTNSKDGIQTLEGEF